MDWEPAPWEPVAPARAPLTPVVNFDLAVAFGVLFGVFFCLSVILLVVVCVVSRKWRDMFGGSPPFYHGGPSAGYGT